MQTTVKYAPQALQEVIAHYYDKYGNAILWETILSNIKKFKDQEDTILADPNLCLSWHGFLYYLSWIESTIGLYDYNSKGSFHRIFVNFGRAYLEEKDVIQVTAGTEKELTWILDSSRYFRAGDGKKGEIDLQDQNKITYDVKNDFINFEKAHDADFLLKYRSEDGIVELHQKPKNEEVGSFIEIYAQCHPVAKLALDLGLDPLLFDKRSTEEMIKNYLGLY